MSPDPAQIRNLLSRYPANPAETRRRMDALLAGEDRDEPTPADLAASVLGQYFTAEDIEQGLAEGGSISVAFIGDDEDGGA